MSLARLGIAPNLQTYGKPATKLTAIGGLGVLLWFCKVSAEFITLRPPSL